jgi:hypothetical protein
LNCPIADAHSSSTFPGLVCAKPDDENTESNTAVSNVAKNPRHMVKVP